jgi:hypothetical protein
MLLISVIQAKAFNMLSHLMSRDCVSRPPNKIGNAGCGTTSIWHIDFSRVIE